MMKHDPSRYRLVNAHKFNSIIKRITLKFYLLMVMGAYWSPFTFYYNVSWLFFP